MYSTHVLWFKPGGEKKRKLRSDTIANNIKEKWGRWWCIYVYVGACTQRGLIIRVWYSLASLFSLCSPIHGKKYNISEKDEPIVWLWCGALHLEKTLIHHTPTGHTRAPRWCWFSFLSLLLLGIFRWLRTMCGLSIWNYSFIMYT